MWNRGSTERGTHVTTAVEPKELAQKLVENVEKVIIGKREPVQLGIVALIAGGHALIEDVPGVGKTMLARSIARSAGCQFRRLQFTPDLLPSDVTGVSVYNQKTNEFEFRHGPIMSEIVLADEINRATPKTQSALLEAMEEHQISVDGVTYGLPAPFMVLATQNPIEYEGTFPLPEAQLDRFFIRISMGYPDPTQEIEIMNSQMTREPIAELEPVATPGDIVHLQESVRRIYVDDLVKQYIVTLSNATRDHSDIALGVSPRASLAMLRGSQAIALMDGRDYVIPDDVKEIAGPVMSHRLILTPAARMREATADILVTEIVDATPVPGAAVGRRQPASSTT
ncbi:MAG: MoxR family ATPase [Chloroflexi bacterium]|nr:MoxR family ATPase [Chloroflexota bacterium]